MKSKIITRAQFIKMGKKRRIVFLAKDVIAQLEAKKFVAEHSYLSLKGRAWTTFSHDASVQDIISGKNQVCEVCAKGALVCSTILNFNNCKVGDICEDVHYVDEHAEMISLFGKRNWDLIELAYEGWYGYMRHSLVELMQNLIDHKGELNVNILRKYPCKF